MTREIKVKKFFRLVVKSKYFYILLIFIFLLAFGQNLDWNAQDLSTKQAQNQTSDLKHGSFGIASTENSVSAPGQFQGEPGKSYRVSFKAKALPSKTQKIDSVIHFLLSTKSPFSDVVNPPLQFDLTTNGWQYSKQIEFTTTAYFNNLIFSRIFSSDTSQIYFSDVVFTQIDCANCNASRQVSGSDVKPMIYGFNSPDPVSIFKFTRSNQIFGQVFKAETDNIFQVKLGLQMTGSGGLGKYVLQLRSDDQSSGNDIISSSVLAETSFSTLDLRSMNIQGDDYIIPLAAKIEKGESYYLALSNEQAQFNLLNTLSVLGSASTSSNSYAFKLGDAKRISRVNFMVYGYENKLDDGRKMLFNESRENLSSEQKLYSYNFSGSPADYLDIFESNFPSRKVFYDTVFGGISSTNDSGNFYTYKFDLPSIPKNFSMLVQTNPLFLDLIPYWSTDNKNWVKLENPNFAQPSSFSTKISDLNSKTLYLKLVTDEHSDTSTINVGNLTNLQVYGEY